MNEPDHRDDPIRKIIQEINAIQDPKALLAYLAPVRDRVAEGPTIRALVRDMATRGERYGIPLPGPNSKGATVTYIPSGPYGSTLRITVAMAGGAQVTTGTVAKPTALEWYTALPCGQQLAVFTVILAVLVLAFDVSDEVRNYVAAMLAVIGAAYGIIQKISKR